MQQGTPWGGLAQLDGLGYDCSVIVDICAGKSCKLNWCGPLVLCDDEAERVPDGIPGVYMIHAFAAARGSYQILYVGKAGDLAARLIQHLRTAATAPEIRIARAQMRLYFSAAPVLDPMMRASVEAGLILRFRPPFNRQIPTAAPIMPTLPPLYVI